MAYGIEASNAVTDQLIYEDDKYLYFAANASINCSTVSSDWTRTGTLNVTVPANTVCLVFSDTSIFHTLSVTPLNSSGTSQKVQVWIEGTTSQTVAVKLYIVRAATAATGYGLAVYNPSGVIIYNSNEKQLCLLDEVSVTPSTTAQQIPISNTNGRNMLVRSQYSFTVCLGGVPYGVYLRKVSATAIEVKLVRTAPSCTPNTVAGSLRATIYLE